MKIIWLMMLKEIDVYAENHAKSINTLCGQNIEFLNVKPRSSHGYRRVSLVWFVKITEMFHVSY